VRNCTRVGEAVACFPKLQRCSANSNSGPSVLHYKMYATLAMSAISAET
jgi:hypothetical protein